METLLALTIGVLVAGAAYLMLARNVLRFIFGLILLSNAANLTIFLSGRLTPRVPPLIEEGADAAAPGVANALPQALVLTAIVIGFGLFAFALVLVFRAYQAMGTLDGDRMRLAEPIEGGHPGGPASAAADGVPARVPERTVARDGGRGGAGQRPTRAARPAPEAAVGTGDAAPGAIGSPGPTGKAAR